MILRETDMFLPTSIVISTVNRKCFNKICYVLYVNPIVLVREIQLSNNTSDEVTRVWVVGSLSCYVVLLCNLIQFWPYFGDNTWNTSIRLCDLMIVLYSFTSPHTTFFFVDCGQTIPTLAGRHARRRFSKSPRQTMVVMRTVYFGNNNNTSYYVRHHKY